MTASDPSIPDTGAALADIAIEAARLILPLWRSGLEVQSKADDSPVTVADQRAEALILERLATAFPGVTVISEEDASEFGVPEKIGRRFFLVDPLDGTKAFVRGDPAFTVNIALIEDGVPVAGAVVAPATGEVWRTGPDGVLKGGFDRADETLINVRDLAAGRGARPHQPHDEARDAGGPAGQVRLRPQPADGLLDQAVPDRGRRGGHLRPPRHDHGMGHRRRPRGAGRRRRPPGNARKASRSSTARPRKASATAGSSRAARGPLPRDTAHARPALRPRRTDHRGASGRRRRPAQPQAAWRHLPARPGRAGPLGGGGAGADLAGGTIGRRLAHRHLRRRARAGRGSGGQAWPPWDCRPGRRSSFWPATASTTPCSPSRR